MTDQLGNRTAVVIGGSSGMGRAVVEDLNAQGARVISTSRDPEKHDATEALRVQGVQVVAADMTDAHGLDAVLDAVEVIDYLVLSAAQLDYLPFRDFSAHEASRTVDGKLLGFWNAVHQLAPRLSTDAAIVMFSGVASVRPGEGTAAVTAANAGIEGLGRSLAVELAPVRVNVLNPGVFETPLWSGMPDEERQAFYEKTASSLLTGRVGQPEDAAHAVRFLLTNPQVTGAVLDLDGGARLV